MFYTFPKVLYSTSSHLFFIFPRFLSLSRKIKITKENSQAVANFLFLFLVLQVILKFVEFSIMDISLIADTVNVATSQGLGFAKSLLRSHSLTSATNNQLSISAVLFAVNALAPPAVRSNYTKTARRAVLRKRRRTRRRSLAGDDDDSSEDGEYEGFFGGDGGGGGDGRGCNFGGFGGHDWNEESSSSSSSDPALNFVYEVICWIALSNCVHFAFKKLVRIVAGGIGDAEREKVPMRLTSICSWIRYRFYFSMN